MTIILIGAIIVVVGGIIGAIGTFIHNKRSSEKTSRIEEGVKKGVSIGETTSSEVLLLRNKIETQSTVIDNLRKENADLYTKLADKSLAIYDNLTGGDSYCRMEIGNISSDNETGYLIFFVDGKNPLNRIQARIVDLNNFNGASMTLEDINKNTFDIGTLDPDKALVTQIKIKLDKTKGVNLNVFFGAANGFTNQHIKMRFINGKWKSATNVTSFTGDKELFRKVDPNFPNKDDLFK